MKIETPLVAVLLASAFFVVAINFALNAGDEYGITYDLSKYDVNNGSSLTSALDKLNETKNDMDVVTDDFSNAELENANDLASFVLIGWRAAKQTFSSLNIFKDLVFAIGQILKIPGWLVTTFVIITLVSFIIMVIMVFTGRVY